MKFFICIFKTIFLILILQNNAFTKGLPPGTGESDVPANVLILLDKSGSMQIGMGVSGISYPRSIAIDSSTGDFFVANQGNTMVKIQYDDLIVDDAWATGEYSGTGNCALNNVTELRVHGNKLYVINNGGNRLFRLDIITAVCDWDVAITDPRAMDIQNNILYAFGDDMKIYDLSGATPSQITGCKWKSKLKSIGKNALSVAVDSSGENLYLYDNMNFHRFEIKADKCPKKDRSAQLSASPVWSQIHSMRFQPGSDTVLLAVHFWDQFLKYTIASDKNSIASVVAKGQYAGSAASSATALNVDFPYGMDVDSTNNRAIFVSSGGAKSAAHVVDFDINFIKETPTGPTRWEGAVDAIEALVTDSSLTSHVDFGFGVWSTSGGSFSGWSGDQTLGTAIPCHDMNCIKVQVHRQGAARIDDIISTINPDGWSTNALSFAQMATDYYNHGSLSPVDPDLDCQDSYVIVIGDGEFFDNIDPPKAILEDLAGKTKPIKTFIIAYGGGISPAAMTKFETLADAGGTEDVIQASTPDDLKTQLRAKLTEIIAEKLAFTAPSVPLDVNEGGSIYQSSFHYQKNKEWIGSLIRTAIDANGTLDETDPGNWSVKEVLPDPDSRKIWTAIDGVDYETDYNNFVTSNVDEIDTLFRIFNYSVADYHSDTSTPVGTQRCSATNGVIDGVTDDKEGLISFVRGNDYFDYDGDCILDEKREGLDEEGNVENIYLGDIYHSELVVVGAPSAGTSYTGKNQESYWRSINGYETWASSANLINRERVIYVGANDGMLHAFNASTGVEKWAFIPPFMAAKLPLLINTALNEADGGGSSAIYGVDGSPVVHDMFFASPKGSGMSAWHTIMLVPYGRGGNGFSILDITDPDAPLHLFSVFNDVVQNIVHVVNYESKYTFYPYVANAYNISKFSEVIEVIDNHQKGDGAEICDDTGNNQCVISNTYTLQTVPKVPGLTKDDIEITKDGADYDDFDISYDGNGDLVFTFGEQIQYAAYDDPTPVNPQMGIRIVSGAGLGVTSEPGYDYSKLGESWSSPRIIRLPNDGPGDSNFNDDPYVAIMGGGFGTQNTGVGSNLTIVNLQDTTLYGKIEKVIDITDLNTNDIVNSAPGLPVVITPDTATGVDYRGALVYVNDLEGKITKFNLTNMPADQLGSPILLYDNTTLFTAAANTTNGRYMYHSMDAAIGQTTGNLWLFSGTGDYERLTDKTDDIENLLLGIKDKDFPNYRNLNIPAEADDLSVCSDTTGDSGGALCPSETDLGWYIKLENSEKVTAEPTVSKGTVYFPIFRPSLSENACDMGDALICAIDDECGSPKNDAIGASTATECKLVGSGVLSKIITFADLLFANIAGTGSSGNIQGDKTDLISIGAAVGVVNSYRTTWRENF
tara:strand:+ start:3424 stop:7569 length:4146 start_codon:yes stop_codon:yes gene_type:complete